MTARRLPPPNLERATRPTPRQVARFRRAARDLAKLAKEGWFLYLDGSHNLHLMSGPSHDDDGTRRQDRILESEECGATGGDW